MPTAAEVSAKLVALAAWFLLLGSCTQDEVSGSAEPAGSDDDDPIAS